MLICWIEGFLLWYFFLIQQKTPVHCFQDCPEGWGRISSHPGSLLKMFPNTGITSHLIQRTIHVGSENPLRQVNFRLSGQNNKRETCVISTGLLLSGNLDYLRIKQEAAVYHFCVGREGSQRSCWSWKNLHLYRWVLVNPKKDNPNSWIIRSHIEIALLFANLSVSFGLFEKKILGISFPG